MFVLSFVIRALYFILPVALANTIPVFVKNHFKVLAIPLDFGWTIGGKPIFGEHKTYRGLIFGTLVSIVITYIQQYLYLHFELFKEISVVPYDQVSPFLLGFTLGFGALAGDAIKSIFKRRLNIKPGERFIPWDQLDFILGALVLSHFVYPLPNSMAIAFLLGAPVVHVLLNHLGYYLKIQNNKW